MRRLQFELKGRIAWLINLFLGSQTATMMSSALLVGALAGLGTVLFRKAVDLATAVLFEGSAAWFVPSRLNLLILPALGGLAVGVWLYFVRPRGPGQGVAGIIEAAAFHGGRIDLRGSLGRVIGAVVTIGTGGSAGPEDPSVQVGAVVGSQAGRLLGMGARQIRTLVGCGSAAGIAAAFNAPISGVFFAVEIILGEFSGISVSYIVIAAVAGAAVSQVFLGSRPAFSLPGYELRSPLELVL
ncbi:MAG: chloride channel protein, partial [Rudaea sp.]